MLQFIILCIIISFSTIFIGCSESIKISNYSEIEEDEEEIEIIISSNTVTNKRTDIETGFGKQVEIVVEVEPKNININEIPDFIEITIRNLGEIEYMGDYHYSIEYYDGIDWISIVSPAAIDVIVVINPKETLILHYGQLMPDNYRYTVGEYRVKYNNWYGEFSIIN
jgi:hypothetical protein